MRAAVAQSASCPAPRGRESRAFGHGEQDCASPLSGVRGLPRSGQFSPGHRLLLARKWRGSGGQGLLAPLCGGQNLSPPPQIYSPRYDNEIGAPPKYISLVIYNVFGAFPNSISPSPNSVSPSRNLSPAEKRYLPLLKDISLHERVPGADVYERAAAMHLGQGHRGSAASSGRPGRSALPARSTRCGTGGGAAKRSVGFGAAGLSEERKPTFRKPTLLGPPKRVKCQ